MNRRSMIFRETAISALVNITLSIVFFVAVFGLHAPVARAAFGFDFLPQAFMVSLMGTLVPSLLLRRKLGGAPGAIVLRCAAIALCGTVMAGGGAYLACAMTGTQAVAPTPALILKALFGGLLSLVVTPLAISALLNSVQRTPE